MPDNKKPATHDAYIQWFGKLNENKPKIEDVIIEFFDGDMKESALSFATYLRENKMKPVWAVMNGWKAMYKGKVICYINLQARKSRRHWCDKQWFDESEPIRSWAITHHLFNIVKYEETIINEGLQDIIWNNLCYCKHCFSEKWPGVRPCSPGISKIVLGKEFTLCGGRQPASFNDPDDKTIDCIKKLLESEQKARD